MARRGENIRKRSDGRWEGRYLIHINGSKKYRSVYASSYNEVKQKLFNSKKESEITLLSQKEQTAPLNASADMSLDEIGQLWLIYIKDNRKYSTYRKYANIYVMHIRDIFGSLTADEISLEIIEKALPKEISASLYKSIYCVLNQILWKPILRHSENSFKNRKAADNSQTCADNKCYRPAEAMPLSALRS